MQSKKKAYEDFIIASALVGDHHIHRFVPERKNIVPDDLFMRYCLMVKAGDYKKCETCENFGPIWFVPLLYSLRGEIGVCKDCEGLGTQELVDVYRVARKIHDAK